jgi:hypothetical protein
MYDLPPPLAPRDLQIWAHGFTFSGDGLACDRCHALIPEKPADAQAHRDWHAQIESVIQRAASG